MPFIKQLWARFLSLRSWTLWFSYFLLHFTNSLWPSVSKQVPTFFSLSWLASDLLSLLFPAGSGGFFPHLPSKLRQELFQHMKHLVPTIWLLLELIQFPRPETYLRVAGIKHQWLATAPTPPPQIVPQGASRGQWDLTPSPQLELPHFPFQAFSTHKLPIYRHI